MEIYTSCHCNTFTIGAGLRHSYAGPLVDPEVDPARVSLGSPNLQIEPLPRLAKTSSLASMNETNIDWGESELQQNFVVGQDM